MGSQAPTPGEARTGQDGPLHSHPCLQSGNPPGEDEEAEEEEEEAAEELGHAETYADYIPSKCECPSMQQELRCAPPRPNPTGNSPRVLSAHTHPGGLFPRFLGSSPPIHKA